VLQCVAVSHELHDSIRRDVDGIIEGLVFIGQDITETLRAIKTAQQVCCSVLQCVAVCCSVLQCVAVCCWTLLRLRALLRPRSRCVAVCCTVLHCAHCDTLQHYVTECDKLEHTATQRNTPERTTTHCNTP